MKILLLQPVRHDGESHEAGATLDLPNQAAEKLITCGAAEAARRGGKADTAVSADPGAKE